MMHSATSTTPSVSNSIEPSFFVKNIVDPIGRKLDESPFLHKVVVVVAHIFRMLAMLALISFLPFGFAINCLFTLAGSLFYRVAIERNCPFLFAIPACLGAMALAFSIPYAVALFAKATFAHFAQALATSVPFGLYLGYIIWSAHTEVNERQGRLVNANFQNGSSLSGNSELRTSCCS